MSVSNLAARKSSNAKFKFHFGVTNVGPYAIMLPRDRWAIATRDATYKRQRCSTPIFFAKLALRVLDQNDPANASSRAANLQTNAEMMADAIVELQALEDRLSKKKIQIYTNTETGAIVQHNGPFFLNPNRL